MVAKSNTKKSTVAPEKDVKETKETKKAGKKANGTAKKPSAYNLFMTTEIPVRLSLFGDSTIDETDGGLES